VLRGTPRPPVTVSIVRDAWQSAHNVGFRTALTAGAITGQSMGRQSLLTAVERHILLDAGCGGFACKAA